MSWLIDDRGVTWREQAHPIAQWDAACDPIGYAVSELGFIHLRTLNGALTVRFNPYRVQPKTVIAAFYLIAGDRPRRVALSHGTACQNLEIFGTAVGALRRIEELVGNRPSCGPATISNRRRPLDAPLKAFAGPVAELLRMWSQTENRWGPERYANLRAANILETAVVVRRRRGRDRLVIDYWGPAHDTFGPRWAEIARGKELEYSPLRNLARGTMLRYRETLGDRQPRLHDVELCRPTADGTMIDLRYERLLLPWTGSEGDGYLVSCIFPTSPPSAQSGDADGISPRQPKGPHPVGNPRVRPGGKQD